MPPVDLDGNLQPARADLPLQALPDLGRHIQVFDSGSEWPRALCEVGVQVEGVIYRHPVGDQVGQILGKGSLDGARHRSLDAQAPVPQEDLDRIAAEMLVERDDGLDLGRGCGVGIGPQGRCREQGQQCRGDQDTLRSCRSHEFGARCREFRMQAPTRRAGRCRLGTTITRPVRETKHSAGRSASSVVRAVRAPSVGTG